MALHYFTDQQFTPLVVSSVLLIFSVLLFTKERTKPALVFLFLGALGLGYFIANLDPFLVLWDEQYHALVAKSMMKDPFKPTLYAIPVLEYDHTQWASNHIWLHKQPLFLWQMALSLKLFGISEFAIRVPSIILHAFAALLIYRIGKISVSAAVGYCGALFFTVAYYPLEMVAGKYATDHNDLIFLCYVTASFWAWFEYKNSEKRRWLFLIGVFAGCAVLVKWLPGLLVFGTWFISIGVDNRKNWLSLRSYSPMLLSAAIALVVFLPWQIYIFYRFPVEAKTEYLHNMRHFSEPLDGHGEPFWFHFSAIKDLYGSGFLVPFFLVLGLFLLVKNSSRRIFKSTIITAIVFTYGFYSFAETKMIAFCMIVSPFFFLGLGALADAAARWLKTRISLKNFDPVFRVVAIIGICFFLLNLRKIQNYHTDWKPLDNCGRNNDYKLMAFIDKLKPALGNNNYAVFNVNMRPCGNIALMFYTDYVAYDVVPNQEQLKQVRAKGYRVAIYDNGTLPDYIKQDDGILKIGL